MSIKKISMAVAVVGALALSPVVLAGGNVSTMAKIVAGINHKPSGGEVSQLMEIAKSGSAAEKIVAEALANMNHSVGDGDKAKLDQVINDKSAPEKLRTLASILKGFNHKPTDMDKQKLSQMTE